MIYLSYWIRELGGWLLILLGLAVFGLSLLLVLQNPPRIPSSGTVVVIGIFIFRGGIHLLKVSVAARICLHAQKAQKQEASARQAPVLAKR